MQQPYEVNKKYKKLEIDLDGMFHRIMLLKKKKYAALLDFFPDELNGGRGSPEFAALLKRHQRGAAPAAGAGECA